MKKVFNQEHMQAMQVLKESKEFLWRIKKPIKPNIVVIYHERANFMATMPMSGSSLSLLTVCDDEYDGMNPFYAYPLQMLIDYHGWVKIGYL